MTLTHYIERRRERENRERENREIQREFRGLSTA
jgi:hypothetical protein